MSLTESLLAFQGTSSFFNLFQTNTKSPQACLTAHLHGGPHAVSLPPCPPRHSLPVTTKPCASPALRYQARVLLLLLLFLLSRLFLRHSVPGIAPIVAAYAHPRSGFAMSLVAAPSRPPSRDVVAKRPRSPTAEGGADGRLSSLPAPIMKLEGHKGEVLGLAFHPVAASAHLLASSSFDGTVMVWDTSSPDIPAVALMTGHRLAVTDVVFAGRDGGLAATASADGTAALWDVVTGERLKVLRGHRSHVNAVAAPPPAGATAVSGGAAGGAATPADADAASGGLGEYTVATASNDKTVRVWDGRDRRRGAELLLPHRAQALAVAWGEADHLLYSSGVDGDVLGWDLRAASCAWAAAAGAGAPAAVDAPSAAADEAAGCVRRLRGHAEPVTGLALNAARTHLVSNAMDHSVRVWDVRPFVAGGEAARQAAVLIGHRHGFDKSLLRAAWGGRDEVVAAGAADGTLWMWEVADRAVRYRLPGHAGPVNAVAFHATQPVVASGGADKVIFLGELLL